MSFQTRTGFATPSRKRAPLLPTTAKPWCLGVPHAQRGFVEGALQHPPVTSIQGGSREITALFFVEDVPTELLRRLVIYLAEQGVTNTEFCISKKSGHYEEYRQARQRQLERFDQGGFEEL